VRELIVKELPYELTDPTVETQVVAMQASGANTFYNVSSPKFAAQAIRKASEPNWKPLQFLTYTSQSISAVLEPAGTANAMGIISAAYAKDPTDPRWKDAPDMKEFLAWMQKYYPSGKADDIYVTAGYQYAAALLVC
jgi:branched-chain amino acid transport system substrate-binding protein